MALKENCTFPDCQCSNTGSFMDCICNRHNLDSLLSNTENALPLTSKNFNLETSHGDVEYIIKNNEAIQIQLAIENLTFVLSYDKIGCEATINSIYGCYNCFEGVEINYICKTNRSSTLGSIQCKNNISFVMQCNSINQNKKAVFFSDEEVVDIECDLICPASKSQIHLKAKLEYRIGNKENIKNVKPIDIEPKNEGIGGFFDGLLDFFKFDWFNAGWLKKTAYIILGVIIFAILICLCCNFSPLIFFCLLKFKPNFKLPKLKSKMNFKFIRSKKKDQNDET